jgi:HK97 family phage portal protein
VRNPFAALFAGKSLNWPQEVLAYLRAGAESVAGTSVTETTALNIAAVMTCVSLRSRSVASLPVRVFERLDGRAKRPAVDHPVDRLLLKPNRWQTRSELFQMLEVHRTLRGNAYAWINWVNARSRDGVFRDQIEELIPLHPDRVEVDQDDEWKLSYKLHRKNGDVVALPQDEVLHLRGLSTNGYMGRSVLQDAREMIGVALATQEHAGSFWARDATPRIALKHPKGLSDKARQNIEGSWEQLYGRMKEKRRVAVLEEGMEVEQLALSAEDSQFLETRKFQRSEIAGWFHVPPHMIGDTEKSTSWGSGIEQQQIGFLTFTLRPDLVTWEQRLTMDLIAMPDKYFIEFNVDGLMRGDATARSEFYWRMVQMGAMSPNDVRALENMNPTPEGDVYLQPTNLAPLGFDPVAVAKPTKAEGA